MLRVALRRTAALLVPLTAIALRKQCDGDDEDDITGPGEPTGAGPVLVPEGYAISEFASGLSYATDITFSPQGEILVTEAGGHTYGTEPEKAPPARILQLMPDGKMYFFLSTQGNAGPIDEHWMKVINIFNKQEAREIPCEDVTLTGKDFAVPVDEHDTPEPVDHKVTGVYVPLGTRTDSGQVIQGQTLCNGAMFRANPDGSGIQRVAWGLRSDYGYRFASDGRLIATQNSANPIPPREIHDDWETVYHIQEGRWYGWPDFYSGLPITDERFQIKGADCGFVLTQETHRELLQGDSRPPQPLVRIEPHYATQGFVMGRREFGLSENDLIVAASPGYLNVAPRSRRRIACIDLIAHQPNGSIRTSYSARSTTIGSTRVARRAGR
jgi:hypothetical protein